MENSEVRLKKVAVCVSWVMVALGLVVALVLTGLIGGSVPWGLTWGGAALTAVVMLNRRFNKKFLDRWIMDKKKAFYWPTLQAFYTGLPLAPLFGICLTLFIAHEGKVDGLKGGLEVFFGMTAFSLAFALGTSVILGQLAGVIIWYSRWAMDRASCRGDGRLN